MGILPISKISDDEDAFDGFYVFDVDPELGENSITHDFDVSHYDPRRLTESCYGPNYLQPRSIVYQGNMVTLKGHTIHRHNLESHEKEYEIDLDENLDSEKMCYQWFGGINEGTRIPDKNSITVIQILSLFDPLLVNEVLHRISLISGFMYNAFSDMFFLLIHT